MKKILDSPTACGLVLFGLLGLVFWQVTGFEFLNYDDPATVTDNPHVSSGLTVANLKWSATGVGDLNLWHPVTWWSHQAVCQFFGASPGAHHLTNALIHAVAAISLFTLVHRLCGSSYTFALFVALLWALHPQRAESVAWITERKGLLAGAFFLGSIHAYISAERDRSRSAYWLSVLLFAAACSSKPSSVTLPGILLLIDIYADKNRLGSFLESPTSIRLPGRLFFNKLPFLALAALTAFVTIQLQSGGGMSELGDQMSISRRLLLIPTGLTFYLKSLFLLGDGRLFVYPAETLGASSTMAAASLLVCIVVAAFVWSFRVAFPWLIFGALWFLVLWLPVSGIIPVSYYFVADRYTYLPQIGPLIGIAATIATLWKQSAFGRRQPHVGTLLAFAAVCALALLTGRQTSFWKDSETRFEREMAINPRSLLAPIHRGVSHLSVGESEQALKFFRQAVAIDGGAWIAWVNLANASKMVDNIDDARAGYEKAILLQEPMVSGLPDLRAFRQLALIYFESGRHSDAMAIIEQALQKAPADPEGLRMAGNIAGFHLNDPARGLTFYRKHLETAPNDLIALQGLGVLLIRSGAQAEGIAALDRCLELNASDVELRSKVERLKQSLP